MRYRSVAIAVYPGSNQTDQITFMRRGHQYLRHCIGIYSNHVASGKNPSKWTCYITLPATSVRWNIGVSTEFLNSTFHRRIIFTMVWYYFINGGSVYHYQTHHFYYIIKTSHKIYSRETLRSSPLGLCGFLRKVIVIHIWIWYDVCYSVPIVT